MKGGPDRHPATWTGVVVAVVASALAVLAAFDVADLTETQTEAVLGFVSVAGALVTGIWGDRKTTPLAAPRTAGGTPLVPAVAEVGESGQGPKPPKRLADRDTETYGRQTGDINDG